MATSRLAVAQMMVQLQAVALVLRPFGSRSRCPVEPGMTCQWLCFAVTPKYFKSLINLPNDIPVPLKRQESAPSHSLYSPALTRPDAFCMRLAHSVGGKTHSG